jgi:hypothetical protein
MIRFEPSRSENGDAGLVHIERFKSSKNFEKDPDRAFQIGSPFPFSLEELFLYASHMLKQ